MILNILLVNTAVTVITLFVLTVLYLITERLSARDLISITMNVFTFGVIVVTIVQIIGVVAL